MNSVGVESFTGLSTEFAFLNHLNKQWCRCVFLLLESFIEDVHDVKHRVIADHLRASSFLIADGVLPSNEGRGYVLRRIMRRAMRHLHQLGCADPVMFRLVPALVAEMGAQYPELGRAQPLIAETLKLAAVVCYTTSGATGLRASRERPASPVIVLSPVITTARRLSLAWGLHCVVSEDATNEDDMVARACRISYSEGFARPGQRIIVTAGVPFGTPGSTNMLRIAFVGSATHGPLPALIKFYRSRFPNVDLSPSAMNNAELERALAQRDIDIAVARPRLRGENLRSTRLVDEPLVLALPDTSPLASQTAAIALSGLAGETWVFYPRRPRPSFADHAVRCCEMNGFTPSD